MKFKETVIKHFDSVCNRDLETLITTLPNSGELFLIFPNGKYDTSVDNFIELHREWFKDTNWELNYEIINTIESSDMGVATIKYTYKDQDGENKTILNLVFQKREEGWVLVHDQNTPIK